MQLRDGRLPAQAARLGAVQQLPRSDEDDLEGMDAETVPFHLRPAGRRCSLSGHASHKTRRPASWRARSVFSTAQSVLERHSAVRGRAHFGGGDSAFSGEYTVTVFTVTQDVCLNGDCYITLEF